MNQKYFLAAAIIVGALLVGAALLWPRESQAPQVSADKLETLAVCLNSKGAVMYGLESCSHCQNQKALFGTAAFAKINYVECRQEPEKCSAANVQAVPSWIFSDGRKLQGEQSLMGLAGAAGCEF